MNIQAKDKLNLIKFLIQFISNKIKDFEGKNIFTNIYNIIFNYKSI